MEDSKLIERAQDVFDDFCEMLDGHNWHYESDREDLSIHFTLHGDDLPIELFVFIDAPRQVIQVVSRLPFTVPEDKKMEMAVATVAVTYKLLDGSFDYNITRDYVYFRLTTSYMDSRPGQEMLDYLVNLSANMVDEYNDKFLALAKGYVSYKDFLQ